MTRVLLSVACLLGCVADSPPKTEAAPWVCVLSTTRGKDYSLLAINRVNTTTKQSAGQDHKRLSLKERQPAVSLGAKDIGRNGNVLYTESMVREEKLVRTLVVEKKGERHEIRDFSGHHPFWMRDGRIAFVLRAKGVVTLCSMSEDGGDVKQILSLPSGLRDVSISQDRRKMACLIVSEEELDDKKKYRKHFGIVLDIENPKQKPIRIAGPVHDLKWSPSSDQLAAIVGEKVFLITTRSENRTFLGKVKIQVSAEMHWSPDGTKILVVTNSESGLDFTPDWGQQPCWIIDVSQREEFAFTVPGVFYSVDWERGKR